MIGVYAIRHVASGRSYIGSSNDVFNRMTRHRRDLKNGNHPNSYLQRAWNKYGRDVFEFVVVQELSSESELETAEQAHLDLALATLMGAFNVGLVAKSPRRGVPISQKHLEIVRAYRPTDATKAIISATHRGRPKSPEHRAKMAANCARARPWLFSSKRTLETRARQAEAQRLSWLNGKRRAAHEAAS